MTQFNKASETLCRSILSSPLARVMEALGAQSLPAFAAFIAAVTAAVAMRAAG